MKNSAVELFFTPSFRWVKTEFEISIISKILAHTYTHCDSKRIVCAWNEDSAGTLTSWWICVHVGFVQSVGRSTIEIESTENMKFWSEHSNRHKLNRIQFIFFNSRISTTILAYKNRLTRLLWNRLVTLTHTRQDRTNYRQTVVANNRQNETPFNPNTSWEKKNERNTNKSTAKLSKQILNCEDLTFVWLQIQWTICLKNEISTYRTHFKFFEYVCLYKPQQISIFFLFSQQQMTQSQN